jgi:outer membrane protein assembly factor BamE
MISMNPEIRMHRRSRLGGRRPLIVSLSAALVALCSGCAVPSAPGQAFLGLITPYRIDIVQGNAVTREQIAQVRPGMTRAQVREILGSPMLSDAFHGDRWDYMFTLRRPGSEPIRRHVVAHFQGDLLKKLDAPSDLPDEDQFVAAIAPAKGKFEPRALELTDAQRKALPAPPPAPAEAAAPAAPTKTYPSLETP